MICIGMSREMLNKIPMYDGMFTVYTTTQDFYVRAYEESTTTLVITDDFIQKELGYENLTDACNDILQVRPDLDIILLGESIQYDIVNTYVIREAWDAPNRVSNIIATVHNRERSLISNKTDMMYRDFLINTTNSDDLISYILVNPVTSLKFIRELLADFKQSSIDKWSMQNKLSAMSLENQSLSEQLLQSEKKSNESIQRMVKIRDRYNELVAKINYQYTIPYEEIGNEGFRPETLSYRRVLYVKEVSPVKYTQTLLYYLQQLMNTLNAGHTRSVIIERPGAYMISSAMYPHHTPHFNLNHGDLRNADIVMVGYQKDIMSAIVCNNSQAQYLIIWDKTGSDNMYLYNERIRPIYTMSDLKDNETFNYPESNILTYSGTDLSIGYIKDFDTLSVQEKLKKYSDMPVMKELLKALEI